MPDIEIDTSRLTFPLVGIPEAEGAPVTRSGAALFTISMAPRRGYHIQLSDGLIGDFEFDVTDDGVLDFDNAFDAFLSGRGERRLTVLGFAIHVDGRMLSHDLLFLGSNVFLPRATVNSVTLIPAAGYGFQPGSGIVADFSFGVGRDGSVGIGPEFAGFADASGSTLTIRGVSVAIDARALSHDLLPVGWQGSGVFLPRATVNSVTLIPAAGYGFQPGSGIVADFSFGVGRDGSVGIGPEFAGFADASGSTLTIRGVSVAIDARALSHDLLPVGWQGSGVFLPRATVNSVTLIPAAGYGFQPGSGIVADFSFGVGRDGSVGIGPEFAGFADASGSTLTIRGVSVAIDARALSHDLLPVGWQGSGVFLPRATVNSVTLIPAAGYGFQPGSGIVADFSFGVGRDGSVGIGPEFAGFADASGSTLTIRGVSVAIDARALSHDLLPVGWQGSGVFLPRATVNSVTLIPAAGYGFQPGSGIVADFSFGVGRDGSVGIGPEFAGFADASGSTLTIRGVSVAIDARALSHDLLPVGWQGSGVFLPRATVNSVTLIPAAGYGFQPGSGIVADFSFGVGRDGRLVVDARFLGFSRIDGRSLLLSGYTVRIDGRALIHNLLPLLAGWTGGELSNDSSHQLDLLPAAGYPLLIVDGSGRILQLSVDTAGGVSIAPDIGVQALAPPKSGTTVVRRVYQSLIQSNLGAARHGNFEAVIVEGESLAHWWRDNSLPWRPWNRGQHVVDGKVAWPGSIIQSNFGDSDHGDFEVVVPLRADDGRVELWHFFRGNSDVTTPWRKGQRVTGDADDVAGPGALIQSNFGSERHGNFEVVVPLHVAGGRTELWHFFHDNADVDNPWTRGLRVTGELDDAAGPGSIIQSNFGSRNHGNFEVVVPLHAPGGRIELWHFFHDNSDTSLAWTKGQRVSADVTGPGVLIQSDFGTGDHGNFEVLVPEGRRLAHYFHENDDVAKPWRRAKIVSESLNGWASLMQGNFGAGRHKNFETLIEENGDSVVGYWHSNTDVDGPPGIDVNAPWLRDKPVISRDVHIRLGDTRKIAQLTGEFDRQGWNGFGAPPKAHNQTETKFGIRGTDLGSSFLHQGRTYFLFGDTWRVNQSKADINLDSIAFTTDVDPDDGLDLVFLDRPPLINPPIAQREFDVPLEGLSDGQSMFVFFSTDHFMVEDHDQMGRSVLARSRDGMAFDLLYGYSAMKFINVSAQQLTLSPEEARAIGVAGADVLCIWGSGRYRSSDVFLSILPMINLTTGAGRRYYAGQNGSQVWSDDEADATALFYAGCVGEFSVRWNEPLKHFILMYNGDSPRGIIMHLARKPWGPWTQEPVVVFDPNFRAPELDQHDQCLGDGFGKFMHVSWDVKRCDHLQDDMFNNGMRDAEWGGEYGPYQIANMTKGTTGEQTQLYFAMSTWNPYQSILMTTRLDAVTLGRIYGIDDKLSP